MEYNLNKNIYIVPFVLRARWQQAKGEMSNGVIWRMTGNSRSEPGGAQPTPAMAIICRPHVILVGRTNIYFIICRPFLRSWAAYEPDHIKPDPNYVTRFYSSPNNTSAMSYKGRLRSSYIMMLSVDDDPEVFFQAGTTPWFPQFQHAWSRQSSSGYSQQGTNQFRAFSLKPCPISAQQYLNTLDKNPS